MIKLETPPKQPKVIRGWIPSDEAKLAGLAEAGSSVEAIAEQLGRTIMAVRKKAFNLGVKIQRVR